MSHCILVVGSGGVGKSSLISAFAVSNVGDHDLHWGRIYVDGHFFLLEIVDTEVTVPDELTVKNAAGFLLLFSSTSRSALNELTELRNRIRHIKNDRKVPMVLVATKSDRGMGGDIRTLAVKIANDWNETPYYETSAIVGTNIDRVGSRGTTELRYFDTSSVLLVRVLDLLG